MGDGEERPLTTGIKVLGRALRRYPQFRAHVLQYVLDAGHDKPETVDSSRPLHA